MNKYSIFDDRGVLLFDLHAESITDALAQARAIDRRSFKALLVFKEKGERINYPDGSRNGKKWYPSGGRPNWNSED